MYRIPKEIDSELKINKALFLFDLLFIIGMLILTMILNNFIHPDLRIVYYIFMGLVAVSMICRPPTNPKKRMYEVLVITMFRKRGVYHAIDRDFN